jgi:hypothetical protein
MDVCHMTVFKAPKCTKTEQEEELHRCRALQSFHGISYFVERSPSLMLRLISGLLYYPEAGSGLVSICAVRGVGIVPDKKSTCLRMCLRHKVVAYITMVFAAECAYWGWMRSAHDKAVRDSCVWLCEAKRVRVLFASHIATRYSASVECASFPISIIEHAQCQEEISTFKLHRQQVVSFRNFRTAHSNS